MGGVGGHSMRLKSSRVRGSSALAVVGGCLGVYVVLATGFHWLVEPTLGKNQGVTAYEPSPARIVPDARQTVAAPVRSEPASRLASKPSTTVRAAGPASSEAIRSETPGRAASPPPMMTVVTPARVASPPPMMTIVTKPAAEPAETARAEAPSRVASKPPMMTIGTKAAPGPTETARSDEQPASGAIAAAESTEPAPAAAKKTHTKRKTVRHERPSREFWNPMNFFAWGSANGARRAF
jgi:hypothetical protein